MGDAALQLGNSRTSKEVPGVSTPGRTQAAARRAKPDHDDTVTVKALSFRAQCAATEAGETRMCAGAEFAYVDAAEGEARQWTCGILMPGVCYSLRPESWC